MIYKELEKIVIENKRAGQSEMYIRNLLKEYLQIYILNYIYTNKKYSKNLIFTGGTCLRHFFDLPRLSEDLDFDFNKELDSEKLFEDIQEYFKTKYLYTEITGSIKQQRKQLLFKFPVLRDLDLANSNESNLLYLKIDLQKNPSDIYDTQISSKSIEGFNFVALHYDLSTLMAGKIHAVLTRERLVGKNNRETIKGRDYYDLLWYLKQKVKPNMKRLCDILDEEITKEELKGRLDEKVEELDSKYRSDFESDLLPLISNKDIVPIYVDNYIEEYERNVKYLTKS
jgi:predicted nucleotidyltransferase component of viral defense system